MYCYGELQLVQCSIIYIHTCFSVVVFVRRPVYPVVLIVLFYIPGIALLLLQYTDSDANCLWVRWQLISCHKQQPSVAKRYLNSLGIAFHYFGIKAKAKYCE